MNDGLRHISGAYLACYVQASACREDHRRVDNERQVRGVVALALNAWPSVDFCGYWQRSAKRLRKRRIIRSEVVQVCRGSI